MYVSRNEDGRCYHVNVHKGEVSPNLVVVGAPERVQHIQEHLKDSRVLSKNRGLLCVRGDYNGCDVTAVCGGMGTPSTAIVLPELLESIASYEGGVTLLRMGTAGSLQPYIPKGSLVVAQAGIRDESTTTKFAPIEYPAPSTLRVSLAALAAASRLGFEYHKNLWYGMVHTKDELYATEFPSEYPLDEERRRCMAAYKAMGALASEMEFTAFSVLAEYQSQVLRKQGQLNNRVECGGILLTINDCHDVNSDERPTLEHLDQSKPIQVTLETLKMVDEWRQKRTPEAVLQFLPQLSD